MNIGGYTIREGDALSTRAKEEALEFGLSPRQKVTVVVFSPDMVGVRSRRSMKKYNWHNLDGMVKDGHGWWIHKNVAKKIFLPWTENQPEIKTDVMYKNINLKGMKYRVVSRVDKVSFIELEQDVGGGSADGYGKKGHCILLENKFLTK